MSNNPSMYKRNNDYEFDFHLYDIHKCKDIPATIKVNNGMLTIHVQGYGEKTAIEGEGCPILVEAYEGKLKVVLWSDINEEEPTHTIDMEKARETNRLEGIGDNDNEGRSFVEHSDPEFRRNHKMLIDNDLATLKKT